MMKNRQSNLTQSLVQKYSSDLLAHLYILKFVGHFDSDENIRREFYTSFFNKIKKSTPLENNPDIFWPQGLNSDSAFNVELAKEIIEFCYYKPLSLKTKFVVLENIHLMTKTFANKLLKTLEEPPPFLCFLLHSNADKRLLATIQSRAIDLRVHASQPKESENTYPWKLAFDQFFRKELSFANLVEEVKPHKEHEQAILNYLLAYVASQPQLDYDQVLKDFKHLPLSQTFHNSFADRWLRLIQL